jgi:hypothetical protein
MPAPILFLLIVSVQVRGSNLRARRLAGARQMKLSSFCVNSAGLGGSMD